MFVECLDWCLQMRFRAPLIGEQLTWVKMLRSLDKAGAGCGWCAQAHCLGSSREMEKGFWQVWGVTLLPEYGMALPCSVQTEVNSSLVMVSALRGAAEVLGRGSTGHRPLSRQNVSPRSRMCGCSPCALHSPRTIPHSVGKKGAHSDALLLASSGPCVLACSNCAVITVGTVTSFCCWATRRTLWWCRVGQPIQKGRHCDVSAATGLYRAVVGHMLLPGWARLTARPSYHAAWDLVSLTWALLWPTLPIRDTDPKACKTMVAGTCKTRTDEVRDWISGGLACEQAPGWCGSGIPTLSFSKCCF